MSSNFSRSLSLLRQEKGISQRVVAGDLNVSQALLSHYENGIREPGLDFVVRACNYYNVSADFLLGRTMSRDGTTIYAEDLYDYSLEKDTVLHGSVMATLYKKLLVNTISIIFDLLSGTGDGRIVSEASNYIGTAIYKVFRFLFRASTGKQSEGFFSVSSQSFSNGAADAEMQLAQMRLLSYLNASKEKGHAETQAAEISNDSLMRNYPVLYQSLLQILHHVEKQISEIK